MMNTLYRYNIFPRIIQESVSHHSYSVALVSMLLCDNYKKVINIDFDKVMRMSLIHDISEISTGADMAHSTKEKYPKLKKFLDAIELDAIKELMDEDYHLIMKEYNDGNTIESLIVQLSDVISCLVYSKQELKMGNTYFQRVYDESDIRIKQILHKIGEVVEKCQKTKKFKK